MVITGDVCVCCSVESLTEVIKVAALLLTPCALPLRHLWVRGCLTGMLACCCTSPAGAWRPARDF